MKSFLGLLKYENKLFFIPIAIVIALALIGIWAGPAILLELASVKEIGFIPVARYAITFGAIVILVIFIITLTTYSILHSVKNKELWLHNHQPIFTLVGSKLFYGIIQLSLGFLVVYVTFFFIDFIEGTVIEYISSFFYLLYFILAIYVFLMVHVLLIYTFNLQLKKWLNVFSYLVTFIFFANYLGYVFPRLPESFLTFGKITPNVINVNSSGNGLLMLNSSPIYIVQEVAIWCIFALIFLAVCKWLERVLTR